MIFSPNVLVLFSFPEVMDVNYRTSSYHREMLHVNSNPISKYLETYTHKISSSKSRFSIDLKYLQVIAI